MPACLCEALDLAFLSPLLQHIKSKCVALTSHAVPLVCSIATQSHSSPAFTSDGQPPLSRPALAQTPCSHSHELSLQARLTRSTVHSTSPAPLLTELLHDSQSSAILGLTACFCSCPAPRL
ncbi:hypothetical protein KFK09_027546 [Dendrobium nobile]|uniref:Uncharacterized protein n=1 Tax=Dendrobium nobile TaxID=94219 RepID=A0A8T3AAS2_DENNO|nr:hypothetical protein KFK09_027546 [Dendrobium nobile]